MQWRDGSSKPPNLNFNSRKSDVRVQLFGSSGARRHVRAGVDRNFVMLKISFRGTKLYANRAAEQCSVTRIHERKEASGIAVDDEAVDIFRGGHLRAPRNAGLLHSLWMLSRELFEGVDPVVDALHVEVRAAIELRQLAVVAQHRERQAVTAAEEDHRLVVG